MENKKDQIKRLQKNLQRFEHMYAADRELLKSIHHSKVVYLNGHVGRWESLVAPLVGKANIYRIHRKYKPEPDTPKFPGYVLCEVIRQERIADQVDLPSGKRILLAAVVNFGCCGYVPKEFPKYMFPIPIIYLDSDGNSSSRLCDGFALATLGWVCFKEKE